MKKTSKLNKLFVMLSIAIAPQIASSEMLEKAPNYTTEYADVIETIESKFDHQGAISFITKIPDGEGYFAVLADGSNIYYDGSSNKIVLGDVYEIDTKENISAKLKGQYNLLSLNKFTEDEKILYPSKVENADWVTIFTDPTCGFCRKIQENIEGYNDLGISIAYVPFPRGSEKSKPYQELTKVWCSDNRNDAIALAKTDRTSLIISRENDACKSIIEKGVEVGRSLQVNGTPSMFTESGYNIPGYIDPPTLRKMIDKTK